MVIFGWGKTTLEDFGATLPSKCSCQETVFFHLIKRRTWFSLYFIPIIPYGKDFFLLCPICERAIQIEEPEKIEKMLKLNEATQAFKEKEINKKEYQKVLKKLL